MHPFTPVLQWFRGPQVVVIDTLGVCGTFFLLLGVLNFYGSTEPKRLRTTALKGLFSTINSFAILQM